LPFGFFMLNLKNPMGKRMTQTASLKLIDDFFFSKLQNQD